MILKIILRQYRVCSCGQHVEIAEYAFQRRTGQSGIWSMQHFESIPAGYIAIYILGVKFVVDIYNC